MPGAPRRRPASSATTTASRRRRPGNEKDGNDDVEGDERNDKKAKKMVSEEEEKEVKEEAVVELDAGVATRIRRLVAWGMCGYAPGEEGTENNGGGVGGAAEAKADSKEERIASALEELSDLLQDENRNPPGQGQPVRAEMDRRHAAFTALTVIKLHSDHVPVLKQGFDFLTNWAYNNPEGARELGQLGPAKVLVSALRRYPNEEHLQWRALQALINLHYYANEAEKRHFVRDLRGVECTVAAMARHQDHFYLQDRAIRLLAIISSVPELRPDLFQAGVLSRVLISAERHGTGSGETQGARPLPTARGTPGAPPPNELRRWAKMVASALVPLL